MSAPTAYKRANRPSKVPSAVSRLGMDQRDHWLLLGTTWPKCHRLAIKEYDSAIHCAQNGRRNENNALVGNLECRTVFGAGLSVIIDPRRRDVGMAKPLLDFGNIRFMVKSIGGRRGAQGVGADLEP
jgi:hypothetical protein